MRFIIKIILAGVLTFFVTFAAITAYTAWRPASEPTADVIVVLGGGMSANGTLGQDTVGRVMKGVALYNAGAAPRIHFTGGVSRPNTPGAGDRMAELAQESGIPAGAITTENRSLSTLQNALFSKPMLSDAQSVILVSEAFHLPRSKASFWWMGYDNISVAHSDRFRRTREGDISLRMLGRETLATWFNLGRAMLWSATGGKHDHWLR
ncbi:YdcF family protein [Yoonia sp. BS5-3]|uniref:YdcF family protein n=1 Tax=Yoonia phaeophyticola TaxID=3137369 RepID=A0ABZ2V2Z9_9RHOB